MYDQISQNIDKTQSTITACSSFTRDFLQSACKKVGLYNLKVETVSTSKIVQASL